MISGMRFDGTRLARHQSEMVDCLLPMALARDTCDPNRSTISDMRLCCWAIPVINIGISVWMSNQNRLRRRMRSPTALAASPNEESGRRIAERRKAKGLSQATLAELVKVSQSTLADWERGKTRPRPAALARLAATLACRPGELIPELEPNGFQIQSSSMSQEEAQAFWQYRLNYDSEEYLYLSLFDEVHAFLFKIYNLAADDLGEGWTLGSVRVSRNRQAVLVTKRLWDQARSSSDERPLAERAWAELQSWRKFLSDFHELEVLAGRTTGKSD